MDFIIGFLAGFAGGLGVGGGGILLLYLTAFTETSFLPTAAAALFLHFKNGFIKTKTALFSVIFGIPGVFLGSFIAGNIDKTFLRFCFALLLLFIGTRELFKKES